jgi:hypothetical protein
MLWGKDEGKNTTSCTGRKEQRYIRMENVVDSKCMRRKLLCREIHRER